MSSGLPPKFGSRTFDPLALRRELNAEGETALFKIFSSLLYRDRLLLSLSTSGTLSQVCSHKRQRNEGGDYKLTTTYLCLSNYYRPLCSRPIRETPGPTIVGVSPLMANTGSVKVRRDKISCRDGAGLSDAQS